MLVSVYGWGGMGSVSQGHMAYNYGSSGFSSGGDEKETENAGDQAGSVNTAVEIQGSVDEINPLYLLQVVSTTAVPLVPTICQTARPMFWPVYEGG